MNQFCIKRYFQQEKERLRASCYKTPHLMIIDPTPQDKGNQLYLNGKVRDFEDMGWQIEVERVEDNLQYRVALSKAFNDSKITGIMVQRPALPEIKIHNTDIMNTLDVDGIHPHALVLPATVRGILEYLDVCEFEYEGRNAVVLGRSDIVGKPMANQLLKRNMTVSICHSKTSEYDIRYLCEKADLIVCATGHPHLISRPQVNPNAIIMDVGINYENGHVIGDFDEDLGFCEQGWSTPVPGGVGLLTRIGLMKNCVELMNRQ